MTSDNSPNDLRNLWQSQQPEAFTLRVEELRKAADRFTRKIYWRNAREYGAAAIVTAGYGYYIYRFDNALVRIGSALVIAAALWVAFRLYKKGGPRKMPEEMDAESCIDFRRSELERQRDLLSTVWTWYLLPFTPGLTMFLLGLLQLALAKPGALTHARDIVIGYGVVFAVCAAAFVFMGLLNRWAAKKLQRQIDDLDALKQPLGSNSPPPQD